MATMEPPPQAAAQHPFTWLPGFFYQYVYAAKFLCGELKREAREAPVEPGSYSTAINVHNPDGTP